MLEKFRKSQTPKPRVTGALRESRASGPISYEQAISEAKAARNRGPHFVIEE
jgi:hypothetical protein